MFCSVDEKRTKSAIQPDILGEADRILRLAGEQKLILRLLGGVGVRFSSATASKPEYCREYKDLDFMGLRRQSAKIENFFRQHGYASKGLFNIVQGDYRLRFFDEQYGRRIDVFLDKFVMCHEFEFKDRLELCERTLSPADLLLTKLQIVEINKKDIIDTVAILVDHALVDELVPQANGIETNRITSYTSSNWGIFKTIGINLDKILLMLSDISIPEDDKRIAAERAWRLKKMIDDAPKSLAWRMRAAIGERMRWYEIPERT